MSGRLMGIAKTMVPVAAIPVAVAVALGSALLAHAQDTQQAASTALSEALEQARGEGDARSQADAYARIATLFAQLGDGAKAQEIATGIEDGKTRDAVLVRAAQNLANTKQYEGPLSLLRAVGDPDKRLVACALIVPHLDARGTEQVTGVAVEAARNAKPETAMNAILEFAAGDCLDCALSVAHAVPSPFWRSLALSEVGWRLMDSGREGKPTLDEAARLARGLDDRTEQQRALARWAVCMARAGQLSVAQKVVADLSVPEDQAAELAANLAVGVAQHGDIDIGVELADKITWLAQRGVALAGIAVAAAAHGDFDRALALADKVDYPLYRGRALRGIAAAMARKGNGKAVDTLSQAEATLAKAGFSKTEESEAAWRELAGMLAQGGAFQAAVEATRRFSVGGWLAGLEALATSFSAAEDGKKALPSLIAEAEAAALASPDDPSTEMLKGRVAVWVARLGYPKDGIDRARALGMPIRFLALADIAAALWSSDQPRADSVLDGLRTTAEAETNPERKAVLTSALCVALVRCGKTAEGLGAARGLPAGKARADALIAVAGAMAQTRPGAG